MIHVDLHETTDSDETEFRPAKAARDGEYIAPDVIPDGFYTVGNAVSVFQLTYIFSQVMGNCTDVVFNSYYRMIQSRISSARSSKRYRR